MIELNIEEKDGKYTFTNEYGIKKTFPDLKSLTNELMKYRTTPWTSEQAINLLRFYGNKLDR